MAARSASSSGNFIQLRDQGVNLDLLETYEVGGGGEARLFFVSGRKIVLGGTDPDVFLKAVGHDKGRQTVPAPKGPRLTLQQMANAKSVKKKRDDGADDFSAR